MIKLDGFDYIPGTPFLSDEVLAVEIERQIQAKTVLTASPEVTQESGLTTSVTDKNQ